MSMEKHVLLRNDGEFFIIVHAAPNSAGKFQWCWTDDPNAAHEENLIWATNECISLTSKRIAKCYAGKWLACRCEVNGEHYNEGCVYLTDDFMELIRLNQFDSISFFDEVGNIRTDICYGKKMILANQ